MASIEKRGENSWRLVVEDGYDAVGKRIRRKKTVKLEDETVLKSKKRLEEFLQDELVRFRKEVESGLYIKPERITLAEFVVEWKRNYADQRLGAYTRLGYMNLLGAYVVPVFGTKELRRIKTIQLVMFFSGLRNARKSGPDKPLSTNTLLNIYKATKSVFDCAVKWKLIPGNPMTGVDRPAADKQERRERRQCKHAYSWEEAARLIEALADESLQWRLYFLGVLLGGFRRGELLGVEWPEVDFDRSGIYVRKQISLDDQGQTTEAELKSESSEGFVAMPDWYMRELAEYRTEWAKQKLLLGPKWAGDDKQYVFHGGYGKPYYPKVPTQHWIRFLAHTGLPRIRLHDLRHTTAMLLLEDGMSIKAIQDRLRHSRPSITADLYLHNSEKINREAANRLEKLNPSPVRPQRTDSRA